MYPLRIYTINIYLVAGIAVPSNYGLYYRGLDNMFTVTTVYFRFGSGFMPVFVKLYGSLMMYGYGSEKLRVLNGMVYVPRF